MLDIFSIIIPFVTASLPTTIVTTDIPSVTPTLSSLPVAQATEVHRLTPTHHICRVLCPFCGGEHLHSVDLTAEMRNHGFGPCKAGCMELDQCYYYWVGLDDWTGLGCVTNELQLKEGEVIWL